MSKISFISEIVLYTTEKSPNGRVRMYGKKIDTPHYLVEEEGACIHALHASI